MIPVAHTVIQEHTVMIELLNTFVAEVTVLCLLRPQSTAWNAHVVEVVVLLDQSVQEFLEIRLGYYIPWVYQRKPIEENCRQEEE